MNGIEPLHQQSISEDLSMFLMRQSTHRMSFDTIHRSVIYTFQT